MFFVCWIISLWCVADVLSVSPSQSLLRQRANAQNVSYTPYPQAKNIPYLYKYYPHKISCKLGNESKANNMYATKQFIQDEKRNSPYLDSLGELRSHQFILLLLGIGGPFFSGNPKNKKVTNLRTYIGRHSFRSVCRLKR